MSDASQHTAMRPVHEESRRLDPATRVAMERSMGASFGDVVVHTGTASEEAATSVDAAAFTVGRHVVFGPGRYDPGSLRGRMLIAHELAHVVQQQRGGGDLDLLERAPLSAVADRPAHAEGHQRTAAQAALGVSAPVAGASAVGVARATPEEESDWWEQAKEAGRTYLKSGVGTIEGVALEGGQIVDTLLWAQSKYTDVTDEAIDYVGEAAGLEPETREMMKSLNQPDFKRTRAVAAASGMIDKDTGAVTVSPAITKGFDAVDEGLDSTLFEGMKAEESFLTTRDVAQIQGAIGSQAALALIGVEEVQLGLKVVSGLGAFKAVVDAIDRNRDGFGHDRAFWMAVAQAGLHVAGLKAASSGKKLLALAVHVGTTVLAASNEVANIVAAYNLPDGPDRDARLKAAIKGLIRVLADQIRQMLTSGKGLPKKGEVPDAETPPSKSGGPTKPPPEVEPPPPTEPVKTPVQAPVKTPVKTEAKAPVQPPVQAKTPTEGAVPPAVVPAKSTTKDSGKQTAAQKGAAVKKAASKKGAEQGGATKAGSAKQTGAKKKATAKQKVSVGAEASAGPGKTTQDGDAPQPTPTKTTGSPTKSKTAKKSTSMTPEVKEVVQKARELTKRAGGTGEDAKKAAEDLDDLYRKAPDDALRRMAKDKTLGKDPRVQTELDRRQGPNTEAEDIKTGKVDPGRMPHEASVTILTDDGKQVYHQVIDPDQKPGAPVTVAPAQQKLKSGGMTKERMKEVGFREASNEVHTEAKAVKMPLSKGQTMHIVGDYDPCSPCQGRMQQKANESGATVVYWWPGAAASGHPGGMRFTPKAGQ